MTDKQPEALRIANELESDYDLIWTTRSNIAAELRRLYWDELRVREHRDQMCAEVTRLHGEVEALLSALRSASVMLRTGMPEYGAGDVQEVVDAAIDAAMKGQP